VAVGPFVCCLGLPQLDLLWSAEVDHATCFGIYHSSNIGASSRTANWRSRG
jgi:hypothetical protein